MKSFIYEHIHPCRSIKITLNFIFQTQSSKFKLHAHTQAILFIQSGFNSNVFVGGSLVDIYAKCGNMQDVWNMFNKMQSENVIYWNAILRGCDTHGHGKEFLKHFGQMFEKGVISYVITIVCLFVFCQLAGLQVWWMKACAIMLHWPQLIWFSQIRVRGSNSKTKRFWLETFIVTYNLI